MLRQDVRTPEPRHLGLADEDPVVREKAAEEWAALPLARRFEILREGLRGGDMEARRISALAR